MDAQRLEALAQAYGGDLRRWPEGERSAAQGLLSTRPELASTLAVATRLDAALDTSPRPSPSAALRDRVIASAAASGLRARKAGRFWFDRLMLASGAGCAAAVCAGVIVGLGLTSQLTADVRADAVLYQASLAGIDDTEVLG